MGNGISGQLREWLAPPHPTWQSQDSRRRAEDFLRTEEIRVPDGRRINVGSAARRLPGRMVNLDLFAGDGVDVAGDLLMLPFRDESVDTMVCTAVLEHVSDPVQAVAEIHRVLKPGGRVFIETPFMQTVHASPDDYSRWTPIGLRYLLQDFEFLEHHVVAGPASGLAWQVQETLAMLFSLRNQTLYRIGLRVFGWLAIPLSWLDIILEGHPMAWHAASAFGAVVTKPQQPHERKEPVARF